MKKIVSLLLLTVLSLSVTAGIHTYTDESVLANGTWAKIRVSESGVCRMSFSQLREAGLDPQQLRVYGYGGAMLAQDFRKAKIDDLPQVPVYVGEDFVLFWVQGPIAWSYNGARFVHSRNTYSNYGYYLLTDTEGELLSPVAGEPVEGTPTEVNTYLHYQVHEMDSLNLVDRGGVSGGGRDFYGEQFNGNQTRTFAFSTPNAVDGELSRAYIDLAGYSNVASYFLCDFNGVNSSVYIKAYGDFYTFGCIGTINTSALSYPTTQTVQLKYDNSTAGALGWLNYIELTTPSYLKMTGSWMPIRTDVNYKVGQPVRFHLSNASSSTQIWDITDLSAITRMPVSISNGEVQWMCLQEDGIREFVAVNPHGENWVNAEVVRKAGEVKNQNLHALKNIDYVIICPEGYEEIVDTLGKAHEAKEAITYTVVTDQQVYNEFSSGTPDATAYRWLMKMLYDRGNGTDILKPRWLLLVGHGTFDNRKILTTSGSSLLLTYQAKNSVNEVNAYATDDYFGFLEDEEGESDVMGTMDIGVGRLPISTKQQANDVVQKIVRYMQNDHMGKWKNQLVFLADDGEGGTHTETSEISAERVRKANPDFVVQKIFLDAYPQEVNASGESYPLAKNRVENLFKNGMLFFDYSGHGGYNAITNEAILTMGDIEKMRNDNQAFWLFATCNFGQCDAGKTCAAEASVLNPNGAAIGILSATRTVYASQNNQLNRAVCDELFAHTDVFHYEATLGEAIARGKNRLGADANKMPYTLLGDPALRLNYPTNYAVQTTHVDKDTLNALNVQHVKGRIIDEDSLTVTDFNGSVSVTVYDKIQDIKTRDNDHTGGEQKVTSYKDYPNTLYVGSVEVRDGEFQYSFMVPKDIRYNFGNGRIVYYAANDEMEEAVGHFEDFVIGGTGSAWEVDTVGPTMRIYLNTPSFPTDGKGKTYPTPRFFAELSDPHGINTAGAGIGHDLLLVVDDDSKKTYLLNEYFTAKEGSYTEGLVSYLMEKLSVGPHSLTFRAWDMMNNSTTASLNFIVEEGLDPGIYDVTTYPNPTDAQGIVNLVVNYDQPDALLETELCLYNMSGQLIWTRKQNNPDQVSIDLSQLSLSAGVYIYNVRIKSATSGYSTAAGKIIVTK